MHPPLHGPHVSTLPLVLCPALPQAVIKPQYVDHIPKAVRGNVLDVLISKDQRGVKDDLLRDLDLQQVGGGRRQKGWRGAARRVRACTAEGQGLRGGARYRRDDALDARSSKGP